MQCFRRCLLVLIGFLAAGTAVVALALLFLAGWLDDPDAPARSDAILVLADDPTRALEAADLYLAGYAPAVWYTVPRVPARVLKLAEYGVAVQRSGDLFRATLRARGVPDAAIHPLGHDLSSTHAEAAAASELLPARRLLIVTSPYHVRRARMIFRDALPDREIRVVASRYEYFPDAWWTDQFAARAVVGEVAKFALYFLGKHY